MPTITRASEITVSEHGEKLRVEHAMRRPPHRLDVLGTEIGLDGIAYVSEVIVIEGRPSRSQGESFEGEFTVVYREGASKRVSFSIEGSPFTAPQHRRLIVETLEHHRRRVLDGWDRVRSKAVA